MVGYSISEFYCNVINEYFSTMVKGYYCDAEGGSFACMDWTFGSAKLKEAEETFSKRV